MFQMVLGPTLLYSLSTGTDEAGLLIWRGTNTSEWGNVHRDKLPFIKFGIPKERRNYVFGLSEV